MSQLIAFLFSFYILLLQSHVPRKSNLTISTEPFKVNRIKLQFKQMKTIKYYNKVTL